MKTLKNWTVDKQSANHLELLVDNQHACACMCWKRTCSAY
ncbi:alpha-glucosidase 2 [Enterobacter cloacae]|uniref:Alpha-glucosidase 2 n=1 Tax=Enterobacter cloacae TaxID=550 RepID=A0A377M596_ENTCL|nr:alpha-glucosidase 2 [Enterobacter cloacae]